MESKTVYDNPWIRVEEDGVVDADGEAGIRGVVRFKKQPVGIVAVDDACQIWLVGQHRYAIDAYSWEIPVGGAEDGEPPIEAAKRELREETGIKADDWSELAVLHVSSSVTDETATIFLAQNLSFGEPSPESGERLKIEKMPLSTAIQKIIDGEITDALTVAAILKAHHAGLIKRKVPILFSDERCVIVDKPANLLVHRVEMSRDRQYLLQIVRDQIGRKVYPAHRLDRPTAGLVLFATGQDAASAFGKLFAGSEVKKKYLALARGHTDDEGVIDTPIVEGERELPARTIYRTLERIELPIPVGPYGAARYSLVEIELKTGRTHQIRRHFARISHHLIGDTKYGDGRHNRMFRENFNCHRLFLVAKSLEFIHPFTGGTVRVETEIDRELRGVLEACGFEPRHIQPVKPPPGETGGGYINAENG